MLESLGITGLKPIDPASLVDYEEAVAEMVEEMRNNPKRGGLIMPPEAGCSHDWQPHSLHVNANGHCGTICVKRCSKCFVLGDFD